MTRNEYLKILGMEELTPPLGELKSFLKWLLNIMYSPSTNAKYLLKRCSTMYLVTHLTKEFELCN